VLDAVRADDHVLDVGTGSGANAPLSARTSNCVIGVDINPHAVAAARTNVDRNAMADRTTFVESDLFAAVTGTFDLIVFDPPF
jgi:release factor glutamine methyltransferase